MSTPSTPSTSGGYFKTASFHDMPFPRMEFCPTLETAGSDAEIGSVELISEPYNSTEQVSGASRKEALEMAWNHKLPIYAVYYAARILMTVK